MINPENPFTPDTAPNRLPIEEISLHIAVERIEAGLLDGIGTSLGFSERFGEHIVEVSEEERAWVSGSFVVDEADPFAPLVNGRMLTGIAYDASIIRNPRDFGGLSAMLVRQTDPSTYLQYDIYDNGSVYMPSEPGLHASLPEGERGRELTADEVERLRVQLSTAAGFGKPRF